jgi:hypothetical protein
VRGPLTAIVAAAFGVACATSGAAQPTASAVPASMPPAPAAATTAATPLPHLVLTAALLAGLAADGHGVRRRRLERDVLGHRSRRAAGKIRRTRRCGLHGRAAADYALLRAVDGYRTVFALAELDPSLTSKVVLIADQRNGAPLDAKLGPFRAIVPDEKHHLRWIRNVIEVDVVNPP